MAISLPYPLVSMTCGLTYNYQIYVRKMIARDPLSFLKSVQDKSSLYMAFKKQYNFHDVETIFGWAAKDIQFKEQKRGKAIAKGLY